MTKSAAWIKALACLGILAGLARSPKLWLSYRDYPLTPVAPFLANLPRPLEAALLAAFIAALVAILVMRRPQRTIVAALALGVALACLDQSRLQPWFYQYLLMLLAIRYCYLPGGDPAQSINACRLIIASIYFWSGIQKLNAGFASDLFPWLIEPFLNFLPDTAQHLALRAGFLAPFLEVAIGAALLVNPLRRAAVITAVAMHCMLLLALGPLGHDTNDVVWLWNIVMAAMVIVLFARIPSLRVSEILVPQGRAFQWFILLTATIAPALSLVGAWDHYPSWALYSGAKNEAVIYLSDALFDRLPEGIQNYVYEDRPGVNRLDIYEWSARELNVPVYPELRVYRRIEQTLCRYAAQPADVRMEVTIQPDHRRSVHGCSGYLP